MKDTKINRAYTPYLHRTSILSIFLTKYKGDNMRAIIMQFH